jgi:hypothetical protein
MSATDKIVLFTGERAAQLIDSKTTVDTVAVMKAQCQNARDAAMTWANELIEGVANAPWPLADPAARDVKLVDFLTNQLCDAIHRAAQSTQGRDAAGIYPLIEPLMKHWADGKIERHQFHGDELARWVAAYGLTSEYAFASGQSAALAPSKRWTKEELSNLATYRDKYGTEKAAKKYGITGARVRKLLPGEKPKKRAYSAFNPNRE